LSQCIITATAEGSNQCFCETLCGRGVLMSRQTYVLRYQCTACTVLEIDCCEAALFAGYFYVIDILSVKCSTSWKSASWWKFKWCLVNRDNAYCTIANVLFTHHLSTKFTVQKYINR
jgi:hypothetical protein